MASGSVSLSVSGGTPDYTYQWSNNATSANLGNLPSGIYTVTVSDQTGCSETVSIAVTQPPPIQLTTQVTPVTCNGGSNGKIDLSVSGGNLGYFYKWSSGPTTKNITGAGAGIYCITVTDLNGCFASTCATITQPPPIQLSTVVTNVKCFGSNDGRIDLSVANGTPLFKYQWNNNSSYQDPNGLAQGVYRVTVTDANNCSATTSATVGQPQKFQFSLNDKTDPACNQANGSINTYIEGGILPYKFFWSNGATTEDLNNLLPGGYTLSATDANGCTGSATAFLDGVYAEIISQKAPRCDDPNSGSIDIQAFGGQVPYTFDWGGGITSEDRNNLPAGTYIVTVSDATLCTNTLAITLTAGKPVEIMLSLLNQPCAGEANAKIKVDITDGALPNYAYSWTCGSQSSSGITSGEPFIISKLGEGTFKITVTNAGNCTGVAEVEIPVATPLAATAESTKDPICKEGSDGEIRIKAVGGTAPYQYLWANGATGNPVTVGKGTWTVTVSDANGCTTTTSGTLSDPVGFEVNGTVKDEQCLEGNNGSITLSVTGSGSYTYVWSNSETKQNITGLTAGIYTVTVTDALGCTEMKSFTVLRKPAFSLMGSSPYRGTAASDCSSTDGGVIMGIRNFTSNTVGYTWSNGPVSSSGSVTENLTGGFYIGGLKTGVYKVTFTDVSGCTAVADVVTVDVATINLSLNAVSNSCDSTGAINVAITGGQAPFTYRLFKGTQVIKTGTEQGNFIINKLTGGNYAVEILDATGCYAINSILVNNVGNIFVTSKVTPVGCSNLGAIELTVTDPSLKYLWSNGATTKNISNLQAGTYSVTLTDANNCVRNISDAVPQDPDPVKTTLTPTAIDCATGKGSIAVAASGGTPPYLISWAGGGQPQPFNGTFTIGNLSNGGVYWVTVSDSKGCTNSSSTVVNWPPNLTMKTISNPTTSCSSADGSIGVEMQSGVAPFSYQVLNTPNQGSGVSNNFVVNNLAVGQYTLRITDAAGCSVSIFAYINAPAVNFDAVGIAPSACTATDGLVQVAIQNGSGGPYGYSYFLNNQKIEVKSLNTSTFEITGLPANDDFYLTVFDGNCSSAQVVCIPQPAMLMLQTQVSGLLCSNQPIGKIDLSVSGGKAPYTYDWNNDGFETPDNDPKDIEQLLPGAYAVIVTDVNGCTALTTTEVKASVANITATAVAQNAGCNGNDGSINLTVFGGQGPHRFDWSHLPGNNDPEDPNGLVPGAYQVTITDVNGCTGTAQAFVIQQNMFVNSFFSEAASSCVATDGNIRFVLQNGTPNFTYSWTLASDNSTGSGTESSSPFVVNGLKTGVYIFTITDAGGCNVIYTAQVGGNMTAQTTTTKVGCGGISLGSITINLQNNEVPPYSYTWSSGTSTNSETNLPSEPINIVNLKVGNYNVTVTNGQGCTLATFAAVTQSNNTIIVNRTIKSVSCNGGNDGVIDITVSGGTSPYNFEWSGPGGFVANTEDIGNLSAGLYAVTVSDIAGCTNVISFTVSQPAPLPVQLSATPINCHNGADGALTLTTGPGQYSFNWSGPDGFVAFTAAISGLKAGTYNYVVTSVTSGCTLVSSTTLTDPPQIDIAITETQTLCDARTYKVELKNINGNPLYKWSDNNVSSNRTFTQSGIYTVTVTSSLGCANTASVEVKILGANCSQISGRVQHDQNEDCVADPNEPGLKTFIVKAMSNTEAFYGLTDANGNYKINVKPGEDYVLSITAPDKIWILCPLSPTVNVPNAGETITAPAFPVKKAKVCPVMTVDISSGNLRRCFNNNVYWVKYCNEGTGTAENAYIVVTLDALMTPVASSKPYTSLGNNRYRFEAGNVQPGDCGTFNIYVSLSCNATLGQTHCSEAHVYPDSSCANAMLQWSGASLRLSSRCGNDSLYFTIKNVGIADMKTQSEYIVIEDVVMRGRASILLPKGDSMIVTVPANGSTWRLEVDQEDFHPGFSNPSKSIEGCSKTTTFSTGFVAMYAQDDMDKFIDIECRQNTAAYDPNDKQGFPTGYGNKHYLRPGAPIEYRIRFQNTGNDTAFTVVLLDTLSAWLDPTSIKVGASSHPYNWDLSGTGILKFTFDNILLPDSNVNEAASHGFVKYSIAPFDTTPLEKPILNRAAIYFDFNPPIITNYTEHRYGLNFIVSSLWQPVKPQYQVRVSPNPYAEQAVLEVLGLERTTGEFILQVFDLQGKTIRIMENSVPEFTLKNGDLPAGTHLFRIMESGRLIGNGKLMVH